MSDNQLTQEIDAFVEREWEAVVADIAYLVEVDSVEDLEHAGPGAPYGPGPREALDRALEIAGRAGLTCDDCAGHIGIADLKGTSGKQLAMIAHADIVPVGTGWDTDPLVLARREGCLLGRGVADDKGPLVLMLYAAKFFCEHPEMLTHTIRCLVGCNEETSMADVEWYLEHYSEPDALFTPDSDFPVCYAEKGSVHGTIRSAELPATRRIISFEGGTVINAVPGEATACVRAERSEIPAAPGIDVVENADGTLTLTARGLGGHAAFPAGTKNAIGMLVDVLLSAGICTEGERDFLELQRQLIASTDGSSIGIAASDDIFDPLTCVGGTVHTENNRFEQTFDSRFPTSTTAAHIIETLSSLASAHGAVLCDLETRDPYVADVTSPFVQTLTAAYNEYASEPGKPYAMGGGTYARHFANGVGFGANDLSWPDPEFCKGEHGPNEGMLEDKLRYALKIYILAIARLMEVDL